MSELQERSDAKTSALREQFARKLEARPETTCGLPQNRHAATQPPHAKHNPGPQDAQAQTVEKEETATAVRSQHWAPGTAPFTVLSVAPTTA